MLLVRYGLDLQAGQGSVLFVSLLQNKLGLSPVTIIPLT